MGNAGLSLDDFDRLTPAELGAVLERYFARAAREARVAWERTRLLASISISPYIKGTPDPRKILPLPWDNENPENVEIPQNPENPENPDIAERYRAVAQMFNLNTTPPPENGQVN